MIDEQKALEQLDELANKLSQIDFTTKSRINFFTVTKMLSLETKHSAFLSWLLSPNAQHGLGDFVIRQLLTKLFDYKLKNVKNTFEVKDNKDILNCKKDELLDLIVGDVTVSTEHRTDNGKFIDIMINVPPCNSGKATEGTIIVIENKIDSTTHDNQLKEYEDYIDNSSVFSGYKNKIFVYLTKKGEIPINAGGNKSYNDRWCIFDYDEISSIIQGVKKEVNESQELNKSEKQKLSHILEDYIEMINSTMLTPKIKRKCESLLGDSALQEVFDFIFAYKTIATSDEIADYVREKLNAINGKTSKKYFYLTEMKKVFSDNGEGYEQEQLRIVCEPSKKKNKQEIDMDIYIVTDPVGGKITELQQKLAKVFTGSTMNTSKRLTKGVCLLQDNEWNDTLDNLKPLLDKRIDKFKNDILKPFINQLENIKLH